MTVGNDVMAALVTRLKTIKASAGYTTDFQKVFWPLGVGEQQPMAADLKEHEMPAIIAYTGPVEMKAVHHLVDAFAYYYLEVVSVWQPDAVMWQMVADIGKAVFGGAFNASENGAYRFHPAVVEPKIERVVPDFGMLPANRVWVVCLLVNYRVRYTNL